MSDWNIVFCLPHGLVPNGMTTWALNTSHTLCEAGWSCIVVAHSTPNDDESFNQSEIERAYGIQILEASELVSENWATIQSTYSALLPAVFFPTTVEHCFEHLAALSLHRPNDVRTILWNHSDHEYEYECIRHFSPLASDVITNTPNGIVRLGEILGSHGPSAHLLPHVLGMHDHEVACVPNQRNHQLEKRPIKIAYAGRFEDTAKRVSDLINIADVLRARGAQFALTLVGTGPLTSQLEHESCRINQVAGSEIIQILPPRPPHEMNEFWSEQDILLLPSAYEGLSMQLLEAINGGCVPVITKNVSKNAPFLIHEINAAIFDVGDIKMAADQIEALAACPKKLKSMAMAVRRNVDQFCNRKETVQKLVEILNNSIDLAPDLWPTTRPIALRSNIAKCEFATEAMIRFEAAIKSLKIQSVDCIAIYGAGRHTLELAPSLAECNLQIVCIIDDDPARWEKKLWGWPIVSREEAIDSKLDAIILSSRHNEAHMLTNCSEFVRRGTTVTSLYSSDDMHNDLTHRNFDQLTRATVARSQNAKMAVEA